MSNTIPQQAAYCLLYKSDQKTQNKAQEQPQSQPSNSSNTEDNQARNNNNNNSNSNTFWQEFEWTPGQKSTVQNILAKNLVKSSIHSNLSSRGNFLVEKLDKEAHLNWDRFYTSHQTNFFKDRHYLNKAFPDEFGVVYGQHQSPVEGENGAEQKQNERAASDDCADDEIASMDVTALPPFTIVEIGCGVGNTVLPLLELDPIITVVPNDFDPCQEPQGEQTNRSSSSSSSKRKIAVWGLDFSKVAVDLLQQDKRYIQAAQKDHRAMSAVWDIVDSHPGEIHPELESCSDISLLLFCLSAVSPEKMGQAAAHVAATLRPGGTLILRDYGRFDEAQLKLGSSLGKRLSENFYVKHDSTRVYYFDLDDLERLFGQSGAGLICIEKKYIQRVYKNRSDNTERRRVWVQARFRKPLLRLSS